MLKTLYKSPSYKGVSLRALHSAAKVPPVSIPTRVPVHLEYDLHTPRGASPFPASASVPSSGAAAKSPVILLHGLFGSKQNYKSVGRRLCKILGVPVYALDLRNHGDSPHCAPFDYLTMTADVAGFLEEHGLRDATVVGHSMGAKVAMCLALQHQDRVGRLVAVDNSPVSARLGLNFEQDLRGMVALENSRSVLKTDKKWRDKGLKFLEPYEKDPKTRMFLISNFTNKIEKFNYSDASIRYDDEYAHFRVPVNYLSRGALQKMGEFPVEELRQLKFHGPTLFLKARHSDFINERTVPLIYHFFPRASLTTFDTNHWLISESPDKFIRTFVDFVKQT